MKLPVSIWGGLILIGLATGWSGCQPGRMAEEGDEHVIRITRDASNKAIAEHDTVALARTLAEDYHVITSRNGEAAGRAAMLERFKDDFSTRPDIIYIRTADQVDVFAEWKMAAESGTWVGHWTENGERVELTGRYFAKWHKIKGQWMIRAEIFVPLTCAGNEFCKKAPVW